MRLIRVLALFIVVAAGAVAEAQCLKCVRQRPGFNGACGESFTSGCDRQCCGMYVGHPCSIPDFLDECDPWAPGARASLVRTVVPEMPPATFFTTLGPVETRRATMHRRLQKLDPSAPKCPART